MLNDTLTYATTQKCNQIIRIKTLNNVQLNIKKNKFSYVRECGGGTKSCETLLKTFDVPSPWLHIYIIIYIIYELQCSIEMNKGSKSKLVALSGVKNEIIMLWR